LEKHNGFLLTQVAVGLLACNSSLEKICSQFAARFGRPLDFFRPVRGIALFDGCA